MGLGCLQVHQVYASPCSVSYSCRFVIKICISEFFTTLTNGNISHRKCRVIFFTSVVAFSWVTPKRDKKVNYTKLNGGNCHTIILQLCNFHKF